jgi:dynein heavy chain, axonemal
LLIDTQYAVAAAAAITNTTHTLKPQLFRVNIALEGTRLDYRPTVMSLTHTVNIVAKELISTITVVPRLRESLADAEGEGRSKVELNLEPQSQQQQENSSNTASSSSGGADAVAPVSTATAGTTVGATVGGGASPSFYSLISNDADTLKIVVLIMNGMSASATELQKYLSYWDKYKYVWENDKDGFIRRYAKAGRALSQFDADIARYRELQADIQVRVVCNRLSNC